MSTWPRSLTAEQFLQGLRRLPRRAGSARAGEGYAAPPEDDFLAENWDTRDATRNVLLFPEAPRNPRIDILAAVQGGLLTDSSLRARVSVIVGPGATPRGIAEQVRPVYTAAATAAQPAPTVDELAEAILVYSQFYIPVPNMTNYTDGLRIPLPIEIDQATGDWILNPDTIRLWARSFPAALQALLDRRPMRLDQPDPAALAGQVQAFLQAQPTVIARGIHLQARILTNPFKEVFFFFEAMRQLGANALEVALAILDQSVNHQMRLLGTLTAGNAVLRRLGTALVNRPARLTAQQDASLIRARNMLQSALIAGGALVPRRELPETAEQLANQPGGLGPWQHVQPNDPPGGRHRIVLGRDVLAGDIAGFPAVAPTHRGPAYGGRIPPAAFIAANGHVLNPTGDASLAARLRIVQAIAVNEGFLDAVRMRDAGILSVGMQQWSAHVDLELPALLGHYKQMAPNEFMLFFGIYDLDVRANGQDGHGNPQFMLQRVRSDGTRVDLATPASRRAFFGGVTAGGVTTFGTDWAARSREPAIASLRFRAAQVLEAMARLDRIVRDVGNITVGGVPVPLTTLITSQRGVALILDAHINQPGHVRADLQAAANAAGAQPTADALDQAITQQYEPIRHTHDTPARNANINAQGLDPHHGSFPGWVAPPGGGVVESLSDTHEAGNPLYVRHAPDLEAESRRRYRPLPAQVAPTQVAPDGGFTPEDQPGKQAGGNMTHKKLTEADRARMNAALKEAPKAATAVAAFTDGPRFVLHDTAGRPCCPCLSAAADNAAELERKEKTHLAELTKIGGTPVGEGPAAYVTGKGTPIIAHPHFFEADRPTATEYERGNDLMAKKKRETSMQTVWQLSDSKEQTAAIASYLSRFPSLTRKDVADETAKATKNLDPTQSAPNNDPGKAVVLTTAAGAVSIICEDVAAAKSAKGIAAPGKEKDLEAACASLATLFAARKERIVGSTNVEISAEQGSDCGAGKNIKPFSGYPAATYDALAKLYLLAAAESGQFPEITTHFFLDRSPITADMNRCDPRCLDLARLYATIATLLAHPKGTTYGIDVTPGTKWGTSTIWWHDPACGAKPAASAPASPPVPKGAD